MNYIYKLQAENAELKESLSNVRAAIEAMQLHLHSSKFIGQELDGSRKDWISTEDILNWLREVKSQAVLN